MQIYCLVVKSVSCSEALKPPSAGLEQLQVPFMSSVTITTRLNVEEVLTRDAATAVAIVAARLLVLGIGPVTVALAGRAGAARAAISLDRVLGAGLVTVALQG